MDTAEDQAQFERIKLIFQHSCSLDPDERASYLDGACEGDAALRAEVDDLLRLDANDASLSGQISEQVRGAVADGELPCPKCIGSYEIVCVLGQGGMGLVYRARQEHPAREVALKVLRPGFTTPKTLRRFELESEVLGRLRHPGIAQIYEAGMADMGAGPQPYFAMELVDGESLLEFARDIDLRAKLALLVDIAHAVEHAHQKGVIHRDLKPDNVLVNAEGRPKVLDFGVARTTDADVKLTTLATDIGQVIGTLPYMSPEQATGDSEGLDERTDVYSLGVIAYQMLSGRIPIDVSGKSVPEAIREIVESEPRPLGSIDDTCRGDIETIVAKALAKEPARRYASAAEFADDLGRHLRHEPIVARPASTIYQIRKLVRRHRGLAVGLGAAFGILTVSVVLLSVLTVQARASERRAVREAEISQATSRFVERFLSAADAYADENLGRDAKVIDFLDRAAAELDGAFPEYPEVEGAVRRTLGTSYAGLGFQDEAQRELERSLAILHEVDPGGLSEIETLRSLAGFYTTIDRGDEAIEMLRQVLDYYSEAEGPDSEVAHDVKGALRNALWERGHRDEVKTMLDEGLERCKEVLGESSPAYMGMLSDYAVATEGPVGLAAARKVFDLYREHVGPDDPDTLNAQHTLAFRLFMSGERQEGEDLMRAGYESRVRVLGETSREALWALNTLCELYRRIGKSDESLATRLDLIGQIEDAGLAGNRLSFDCSRKAAMLLESLGRLDEACEHARASVEGFAAILPHDHNDLLRARYTLAHIEYGREQYRDALEQLRLIVDDCERVFDRTSFRSVLLTYGRSAERAGELGEALRVLSQAAEVSTDLAPDDPIMISLAADIERIEAAASK